MEEDESAEAAELDGLLIRVADAEARARAADARADELAALAKRQADLADQLHAENQKLRDGELRSAVLPLVRGLARLGDDLERLAQGRDAADEDLGFVAGRVADLLHDAGVTTSRPEPGAPFDPQAHHAASAVPTDDPDLDRTIAEVRRVGLQLEDGRQLRPADVVVHRFSSPKENE